MRVLLVRHGNATSNAYLAETFQDPHKKPSLQKLEACAAAWRVDDELTPKGLAQARLLAAHYAPALRNVAASGRPVLLVSSAMNRAIQTALPLAQELGQRVHVHAKLHETGMAAPYPGMLELQNMLVANGQDKMWTSAADIASRNSSCDVSWLPTNGPIIPDGDPHEGFTPAELYPSSPTANPWGSAKSGKYVGVLFDRSRAVLEWMQSDALQTQVGDGILVLFTHSAFACFLLADILDMKREGELPFSPMLSPQNMGNSATHLINVPRRGAGISLWINSTVHLSSGLGTLDDQAVAGTTLEEQLQSSSAAGAMHDLDFVSGHKPKACQTKGEPKARL